MDGAMTPLKGLLLGAAVGGAFFVLLYWLLVWVFL
jgi:hypothetical protein